MLLPRLFLGCTLLGVGLLWPTVASAMTSGIELSQTPTELSPESFGETPASDSAGLRLEIEERFSAVENEPSLNYRFTGSENEIIVMYVEQDLDYGEPEVTLLVDSGSAGLGEPVPVQNKLYYPPSIDFNEMGGRHIAFRLPETGTYLLSIDGANFLREGSAIAASSDALLRLRSASFYERLMIGVERELASIRYDEAARLAGLAIAQRPDLPMPHIARIRIYIEKVLIDDSLIEGIYGLEEPTEIVEEIYAAFLTLERDEQAAMIDDFRQVAAIYQDATESGAVDIDSLSFGNALPTDFEKIAEFLQTGEVSETILMILFSPDR